MSRDRHARSEERRMKDVVLLRGEEEEEEVDSVVFPRSSNIIHQIVDASIQCCLINCSTREVLSSCCSTNL